MTSRATVLLTSILFVTAGCSSDPGSSHSMPAAPGPITVRRNLAITGEIRVTNPQRDGTFDGVSGLRAFVDGRFIGANAGSSYCAPSNSLFFPQASLSASVEPGRHELTVDFTPSDFLNNICPGPGHVAFTDPSSRYRVIDQDTGEVLAEVPLDRRDVVGARSPAPLRWVLEIGISGNPIAASGVR
jgi:hypothetical protein